MVWSMSSISTSDLRDLTSSITDSRCGITARRCAAVSPRRPSWSCTPAWRRSSRANWACCADRKAMAGGVPLLGERTVAPTWDHIRTVPRTSSTSAADSCSRSLVVTAPRSAAGSSPSTIVARLFVCSRSDRSTSSASAADLPCMNFTCTPAPTRSWSTGVLPPWDRTPVSASSMACRMVCSPAFPSASAMQKFESICSSLARSPSSILAFSACAR
mmetsp:Transcript_34375/g.96906  ORF Transcript_34375/g.96906 Transcript_34375/m.96906 type:complete len:216 (-) Transcript_34375:1405-2052(-)